jgi:hypothetical protein
LDDNNANTGVDSGIGDEDDDNDDNDDNEVAMDTIYNQFTKQSYTATVVSATTGTDLLKLINLLPNSLQLYVQSITMNALTKIVIHHPSFCEWSDPLYSFKVKKGKETKVVSMLTSLNQVNKQLFKSMLQELKSVNGPWFEAKKGLHNCDDAFNDSAAALRQIGMPAN